MQSAASGGSVGRRPAAPEPPIARGRHTGPDDGACLMELASMMAGEPWSDSPHAVHPVLASVARAVNDRVGDATRSRLGRLVPMMLDTERTGLRGCAAVVAACADAALDTEYCDMATRCGLEAARRRARRILGGRALSARLREHRIAIPLAGMLDWAYCHGSVLRTAEAVAVVANAEPDADRDEDDRLELLLAGCAHAASQIAAGEGAAIEIAAGADATNEVATGDSRLPETPAVEDEPPAASAPPERRDATLVGV